MKRETRELDKMHAVRAQSQPIGEFIDWLQSEKQVELCKHHQHTEDCYDEDGDKICGAHRNQLVPFSFTIEKLLAEYFKIDLNKIEQERRAILEELQTTPRHGQAE